MDVHPDRPISRGIAPGPTFDKVLCAIPPDPTFTQIEEAGGVLEKHAEGHAVAGRTVWVSGEIPRLTTYEAGMLSAVRWIEGDTGVDAKGKWVPEHVSDSVLRRMLCGDAYSWTRVMFSACHG